MSDYPIRSSDHLPDFLQSLRKSAGLTQVEVARRLGVTQQTYSALERRAGRMSVERLLDLLALLNAELVLRERYAVAEPSPDDLSGKPRKAARREPLW